MDCTFLVASRRAKKRKVYKMNLSLSCLVTKKMKKGREGLSFDEILKIRKKL